MGLEPMIIIHCSNVLRWMTSVLYCDSDSRKIAKNAIEIDLFTMTKQNQLASTWQNDQALSTQNNLKVYFLRRS